MKQLEEKQLIAYRPNEFNPMKTQLLPVLPRTITAIELGGGYNALKSEGYHNFDIDGRFADTQIDFEQNYLPLESDSIEAVYSAHCLEHISVGALFDVLIDLVKACKIGATLLIKVPHWNHQISMYPGHNHTVSDRWWFDNTQFPERWIPDGINKCFRLDSLHYQEDVDFTVYRRCAAFDLMSDRDILRLMPGACHEIHVHMTCVEWFRT